MPYQWSNDTDIQRLTLWPYRSLPPRGFVIFISVTASFFLLPLLAVLGTFVFWALLPFLLAAVGAIWWALQRNNRDRQILEELTLTDDKITLSHHAPGGETRSWSANPYWVRVTCLPKGGPVENYLTLEGGPRLVEIGAFLGADERHDLMGELERALRPLKSRP